MTERDEFALLAGYAIGLASRLNDETAICDILRLPTVQAIARQDLNRLLAKMMRERGISIDAEVTHEPL